MLDPRAEHLDLNEAIEHFQAHGYASLGPILTEDAAAELAARAEALMGAEVAFPGMFFQHEPPSAQYEDVRFNAGWVGPSTRYRKLERLELDPLFRRFIENRLFERLTERVLGADVRLYRSVLWNKAPRGGMAVPWHQDDGRFWGLDRRPSLQVWTALDDAPLAAGCLEVVPGSHRHGLATPEGGTIPDERLEEVHAGRHAQALPARRGHAYLVHNHTWHRTGRNRTDAPRRAVSISFLDGVTRCTRRKRAPRTFERLFHPPHAAGWNSEPG